MPTSRCFPACLAFSLLVLAGLTGCYNPPPAFLWSVTGTVWNVVELEGEMVGAEKIPTLQLEPNGPRVAAFGGINRLSGTYTLKDDALTLGPLVSTRMAGAPKQMKVEEHFQQILGRVDHYKIIDQWLILQSGKTTIARARAMPATPFVTDATN